MEPLTCVKSTQRYKKYNKINNKNKGKPKTTKEIANKIWINKINHVDRCNIRRFGYMEIFYNNKFVRI